MMSVEAAVCFFPAVCFCLFGGAALAVFSLWRCWYMAALCGGILALAGWVGCGWITWPDRPRLHNREWAFRAECRSRAFYRQKYSPIGAWIEVDGHALAVREDETKQGVRIIEFITDWPEGEPAKPPQCSADDPRWQGRAEVRNGRLVLLPAEALTPRPEAKK